MDDVSKLRALIAKLKVLFGLIEVGLMADRTNVPEGFLDSASQIMLRVGGWDDLLDDLKNDPNALLRIGPAIEDLEVVLQELSEFWPVAVAMARPVFPELFDCL